MWDAMNKALQLKYGTIDSEKSLLYNALEDHVSGIDLSDAPIRYFIFKSHTQKVMRNLLRRAAFDTLIQTSQSIFRDYLKLFPFQQEYLNLILNDVNNFYDDLQKKGPSYFDSNTLERLLSLEGGTMTFSTHFQHAENVIQGSLGYGSFSYNDIFYVPREQLNGHLLFQPQSLLYYATKLNANSRFNE
jgi:hypothetical protein